MGGWGWRRGGAGGSSLCMGLPRFGRGTLSSNLFIFGALYWSLGRRWYFCVSNVALVVEVFVLSGFGLSIVILCVWVVSFSAYYMEFYAFILGLPYPFCRFVVFINLLNYSFFFVLQCVFSGMCFIWAYFHAHHDHIVYPRGSIL